MSPTDLPQVPSPHAGEIIGSNWPEYSETGALADSINLFRAAAESVGTGDTAETMIALIESSASGHTPDELVADFTDQQRQAFDAALRQLNQGHVGSAMAQDILNTKVALNGTVVEFEAAVEQLLAAAAAAPQTPKTQEEFQRRYQELLDAAKSQASQLGSNHNATQEALLTGVESGTVPEMPSTMTPTPAGGSIVPGMPDGALGGMLQSVAGQMMKPQNLGFPNLGQMGQQLAPLMQAGQAAIGQLMGGLPGAAESGIPISDDALSALTSAAGGGDQAASLTAAGALPGAAAGAAGAAGGAAAGTSPSSATRAAGEETGEEPAAGVAPLRSEPSLVAPGAGAVASPPTTIAAVPSEPAVTAAPATSVPATTLSSAMSGDPLSVRTHTSGSEVGGSTATLTPTAAAAHTGAPVGGGMPMMPMMPMGAGTPASGPGTSPSSSSGSASTPAASRGPVPYEAERPAPPVELTDFGSDLKGLEHATDSQLVAASVLAALVRMHDRMGMTTEVAVGVNATGAVFATSDGLGFLPPATRAAGHLTPLITQVPEEFTARWLGCNQPWRPLQEAAEAGLVGPFDAVVTTDSAGEMFGVLAMGSEDIAAVNITAGSQDRWHFDAVAAEDISPVLEHLILVWGRPTQSALDLESKVHGARWSGATASSLYPRRWAHYLIAAALSDLAAGDTGDARYALRSALRIPEPKE